MRKFSLKKLLKAIIGCILIWVCFTICMETKNMWAFTAIISAAIVIIMTYLLFDKLDKIIKLLQEIADKDSKEDNNKGKV